MGTIRALRPDVPSFGYAAVLSINAASIWGGIFPYLPAACQTELTTIVYYIVQMTAFGLTFCGAVALAWLRPRLWRAPGVMPFAVPLGVGPLMLVGAMYVEALAGALILGAAVLVGFGLAGFMLCWQRVFAAMDAERGNRALIKGTGFSALLYLAIGLVPAALTAYLIPLVLVPLAGLCLWLASRSVSTDQPMFEDIPREHAAVYRNALRVALSPALSVGALGFCAGAIRFIAITHQGLLSAINIASMVVLLAVMVAFYAAWQRRTLHIGLSDVFLLLFPVAAICLMVLPFAGPAFTNTGFGLANACFMLACVFMMMHCGQLSRDNGIGPVFVYAFYGAVAYLPQTAGYLTGYASGLGVAWSVEQFSFVSLASLFVLLMASLAGRRRAGREGVKLELLAPTRGAGTRPAGADAGAGSRDADDAGAGAETWDAEDAEAQGPDVDAGASDDDADASLRADDDAGRGPHARDALSLRCQRVSGAYGLSSRETEVMELIARGYSGPAIAEMLFISENTMRTHNKRIYAKLDVHKKQELIALINAQDA